MKRNGQAIWEGELNKGHGRLSTASGALADVPYSFSTRFGNETGTNPEELIAAAHAGCFCMSLAFFLGQAGLKVERIHTRAELVVENQENMWSVVAIHLTVTARIPGATEAQFQTLTEKAERGCLVSRLVKTSVTLHASLESA